jgi:ribonuclease P protein component
LSKQEFDDCGFTSHELAKGGLRKSEILRSRELFKRIVVQGKRMNARFLRCSYMLNLDGDIRLQVGFKVPAARKGLSEKLNAVRRNRLRRLMREAFVRELPMLNRLLEGASCGLGIALFYRGGNGIAANRISLNDIQQDIRLIVGFIVSSAEGKAQ